jgi:hypothetical protein
MDLLHPPDKQLQVRAPGQERVQAALGAPGEIAAQIGVRVVSGGALEPGKIGSYCEPQPISMRDQITGPGGLLVVVHHASTLRPLATLASRRRARGGMRVRSAGTVAADRCGLLQERPGAVLNIN